MAAQVLINELQSHFSLHEVMDALGMLYPQYWLQIRADVYFPQHLAVLKAHYSKTKTLKAKVKGADPVVVPLFASPSLGGSLEFIQIKYEE